MIYTYPSFWEVFRGAKPFFIHLVSKSMYIPVRPYVLTFFVSFFLLINVPRPSHRSFADPYGEKTPRKFQFGKKSSKVYCSLYSSTEQLQVALWTYIFLWFGLNNEKSLHTLPLRSAPVLSLHLYPSLSKPSVSSSESVWLFKLKE